jgi:hypothetical protein
MGYDICDVDGYVAAGPNITGWKELRDKVLLPQGGPATHEFVQEGTTEQLEAFRAELAEMKAPTKPTATSLAALRKAVGRAKLVVILSTGA